MDKQQPPPGAKEKAEAFPPSAQGWSYQREALQDAQRMDDPLAGVGGQAVRADEPVEVFDGDARELDASHGLQLVQRDRLAGLRLPVPELGALVRSGDAVQQLRDVTRVRVGVIECTREQGTSNRPGLDVHAIRETSELLRLLVLESDVQPLHTEIVHETLLDV
jgi:hypothetical protein